MLINSILLCFKNWLFLFLSYNLFFFQKKVKGGHTGDYFYPTEDGKNYFPSQCLWVRLCGDSQGLSYFISVLHRICKSSMCVLSYSVVSNSLWTHGPWHAVSPVHGISQVRILEFVAISFFRGSSWPRDQNGIFWISCIGGQIIYHWAIWEAHQSSK